MTEIIPAILTNSPLKFEELIRKIESYTQRIHIDIADGIFVPNKTVNGHDELKRLKSSVKFDIHLMVQNPINLLNDWFSVGTERIIVHIESNSAKEVLQKIKENGRKAVLALNPDTDLKEAEPFVGGIDLIQFMTVYPGFQGGKFAHEVVDKISEFHGKYPDIMIMCDGGITSETAPQLVEAGATQLVVGSYIVSSENIEKTIEELKRSIFSI